MESRDKKSASKRYEQHEDEEEEEVFEGEDFGFEEIHQRIVRVIR